MNTSAVVLALCSLFFLIDAYPLLTMPQFPASRYDEKVKRNSEGFPLTDDEVLQLEHLKVNENQNREESIPMTSTPKTQEKIKSVAEILPNLEFQLESVKPNPVDESKSQQPVPEQPPSAETSTSGSLTNTPVEAPAVAKQYHGAARLAFGQNPEVLPTLSTTSTTTVSTISTTSITTTPTTPELPAIKNNEAHAKNDTLVVPEEEVVTTPTFDIEKTVSSQKEETLIEETRPVDEETNSNRTPPNIGESAAAAAAAFELLSKSKMPTRRSASSPMSFKAAERLLQHRNGQYSAFDMAQYVFWTGDESGVARAVEELIERDLMTRENALKFLREIRMGIEYLERSYANRVIPTDLRQNHIKKTYTLRPRLVLAPSTTTEHISIPTEKPVKTFVPLWRSSKPIDSVATWSKLQELNANEAVAESNDYDETSGRAKIAEFLYTEYTLEEILYKLAKVMFTQSLAHGSDEAQKELQKLTDFLEREGNLGVIPIDLQKKVLNTLLTALSDTLSEHPELLPAARSNLGVQYNKLDE